MITKVEFRSSQNIILIRFQYYEANADPVHRCCAFSFQSNVHM